MSQGLIGFSPSSFLHSFLRSLLGFLFAVGIVWLCISPVFSQKKQSSQNSASVVKNQEASKGSDKEASEEASEKKGIAVVDLEKVFESFPARTRVHRDLLQKRQLALKELKTKYQELKKSEQELKPAKDTWTIEEFRESLKEIQKSRQEFLVLVEEKNQELQDLEAKWRKSLFEAIFEVLEELRKERGYLLVLSKSSLLVYDSVEDWTVELTRRLRSYKESELNIEGKK